jgi:hypothetical protein
MDILVNNCTEQYQQQQCPTLNVPKLSSKSAYIDHTLRDLYNLICTDSVSSWYATFRGGITVAFCINFNASS